MDPRVVDVSICGIEVICSRVVVVLWDNGIEILVHENVVVAATSVRHIDIASSSFRSASETVSYQT